MKQRCKKREEIFLLAHFLSSFAIFNFLFLYIDSEHYDAKTYTQHCGEEKRISRGDITMYKFTRWEGGRR